MDRTAFELREEFAGTTTVYDTAEDKEAGRGRKVPTFAGGVVALADGSSFDVGAELKNGDGVIVVENTDAHLIDVLNAYPALKRTKVPEGAESIGGYEHRTAAVLRQEAARRGLATSGSKVELVERLEANDQAVADGDQERASDPTPETADDGEGA